MTRYINYSGQIKSEKELKKLIKETIQLTNHKELTIFKNILKEDEEKQLSSSFEFEDAFKEIGKEEINDKDAQGEIVKKNNITLFVLFHMFDDTFTSKWKEFYESAKLNAENQEEYRTKNKRDVQDKLKVWVEAIKKAKDVNEFNKATKKLKKDIDNSFFYWEPLLIIGKNINGFNKQIRDTLFNTLKDSNNWETAAGKITYPSENGDKIIKDLLRSTTFFNDNTLTTDEKKAIWKEKVESGWGSLFGGSGSDDGEGIWSWIKGLLNSAAAFFLGDDYKNVADDLFKGLGKFENMLNDKDNPKGAQDLIRGLFNLGDEKADNKITTQQYAQKLVRAVVAGEAPKTLQAVAANVDQLSTQNNIQKEDTKSETAKLETFDPSIFTNAINEVKKKWLADNSTFKEEKKIKRISIDGMSNFVDKTQEENCLEIEEKIKLINLDLYIIYTILSNVDSIKSALSLNPDNKDTIGLNLQEFINVITQSVSKNSAEFNKLYDELYNTSTLNSYKYQSTNIPTVDISTFCDNLVKLYDRTIIKINQTEDLNWFGKYLTDQTKKKQLITSIEKLNQGNVWKKISIITLFQKGKEEIFVSITQCISNWDDISDNIKQNFGEWLLFTPNLRN